MSGSGQKRPSVAARRYVGFSPKTDIEPAMRARPDSMFTSTQARETPTAIALMLVLAAVPNNTSSDPLCSNAGLSGEQLLDEPGDAGRP